MKGKILRQLEIVDRIPNIFLDWLQSTDFFIAPASTKHHNVFEGGLALHSWNVFENLFDKVLKYKLNLPYETIAICALLHDLCKINKYHKVEEGGSITVNWIKEDKFPLGHSAKSIYLIQQFFTLTEQEAIMIYYHMGPFEHKVEEFNNAFKLYPEVMALYLADHEATAFMGQNTIVIHR